MNEPKSTEWLEEKSLRTECRRLTWELVFTANSAYPPPDREEYEEPNFAFFAIPTSGFKTGNVILQCRRRRFKMRENIRGTGGRRSLKIGDVIKYEWGTWDKVSVYQNMQAVRDIIPALRALIADLKLKGGAG